MMALKKDIYIFIIVVIVIIIVTFMIVLVSPAESIYVLQISVEFFKFFFAKNCLQHFH